MFYIACEGAGTWGAGNSAIFPSNDEDVADIFLECKKKATQKNKKKVRKKVQGRG